MISNHNGLIQALVKVRNVAKKCYLLLFSVTEELCKKVKQASSFFI